MNSLVSTMTAAARKYLEALSALAEQSKELEAKNQFGTYSPNYMKEKREEIAVARESEKEEALTALDKAKEEYHSAVDAWNVLRGEDVHPDAELLKTMELDSEEYTLMLTRHMHNPTMLRILSEYRTATPARAERLLSGVIIADADKKKSTFDDIHRKIHEAVIYPDGYTAAIIKKGDMWETHVADADSVLALPAAE